MKSGPPSGGDQQHPLQTLADEGVDAERLVQSWPMRGNRAEVSRTELEALVRKRGK